ncbi:hypothetical protein [Flavobacterium sp. 3HN19-14]|uniref:hypothetical protein n=1 Tax=Flavobacterium sp. 3HN19-14 TaxID=3448133 RepID=UPI003EE38565
MIVLLIGVIHFSCKQNENPVFTSHEINESFNSGIWKISSYIVDNAEQKAQFERYHFSFSNQNIVTVADGKQTYKGKWSVTKVDGDDDSLSTDTNLVLIINPAWGLSAFSKDWTINDISEDRLVLENNDDGATSMILTKVQQL